MSSEATSVISRDDEAEALTIVDVAVVEPQPSPSEEAVDERVTPAGDVTAHKSPEQLPLEGAPPPTPEYLRQELTSTRKEKTFHEVLTRLGKLVGDDEELQSSLALIAEEHHPKVKGK